jgi:hypothetical protein
MIMTSAEALTDWRAELEQSRRRVMESVELALVDEGEHGRESGSMDFAEGLKQTVRRLRRTEDESSALSLIVSSTVSCCTKAAVFVLEQDHAKLLCDRGLDAGNLSIEFSRAAAFFAAIETKDPVVALANDLELSPEFYRVASAGFEPGERAYLFPVVTRNSVVAIFFAIGQVKSGPMELLAEMAASHLEGLRPKIVHIQSEPEKTAQQQWQELSPADQAQHLRAQRFARLKVSEMRVYYPQAVRSGIDRGDLYALLKAPIDEARSAYRKEYAGMFDYLYLELLGNLANHDDRLLGPDFPGPIV